MITQATIDQIFLIARIEEVIGEYVTLKKRGANYIGLCPFHEEKTPSFNVSPSKEIYKCFGCGKAGNVIRFLMDHERFTYPEALRYLANKYQIPIEETKESVENLQEKDEISSIYIILNFAQTFYHNYLLTSEEGKNLGLEYFKNRGIRDDTIIKFQLGFSPSNWDLLYKEAIKIGYKEEQLFAAGLIIKKEDGSYFDRFRERIMFPIHSPAGRTLGFGARTLKTQSNEAKYINSPETKVYNKSNVLYGLFQAKEDIRRKETCYLVEGYLDLISLHQSGIENVVASLGTSLTDNHTKLIKRYSNNLTFIFDGDEAGIKASLRGIDIALKEDLNVKVVALPQGEDPDSFANKNPKEIVQSFIEENTKDFIIYKSDFLYKEKPNDPIHKYEVIKSIVQSLSFIKNRINQSIYIKELSRILSVNEEILYAELNNQINNNRKKESSTFSKEISQSNIKLKSQISHNILPSYFREYEKQILRVLLLYGEKIYEGDQTVANHIMYTLSENEWENELYKKIYNYYQEYLNINKTLPSIDIFKRHPDLSFQEIAIEFEDIFGETLSPNWKKKLGKDIIKTELYKEINNIISHFELNKYRNYKEENLNKLKVANLTDEQKEEIQKSDKYISDLINKVAHELNIAITK